MGNEQQCPECGGSGWVRNEWATNAQDICPACHGTGKVAPEPELTEPEPKRCKCYSCSGQGWKTVLVDAGPVQIVTCRLCGGSGEITAPQCRCGWCHYGGVFWVARGGIPVSHCPECGCLLSVNEHGQPVVGKSVAELEAENELLAGNLNDARLTMMRLFDERDANSDFWKRLRAEDARNAWMQKARKRRGVIRKLARMAKRERRVVEVLAGELVKRHYTALWYDCDADEVREATGVDGIAEWACKQAAKGETNDG